jgi:pimeloyl-ACP methyl ester carboxylesterase
MRARPLLAGLIAMVAVAWIAAPAEPVISAPVVDPQVLPDDLDLWLAEAEGTEADLLPDMGKEIVWAGPAGQRTPLAIVYLHGFSASKHEIRPVPDHVAVGLGANLFFTRLSGHGRGAAAMGEPHAGDWLADLVEALAVGRRLGDRVLIIGTSTGATLAAFASTDSALSRDLAGVVMVSPNFGLRSSASILLDMPYARWWGPFVAGAERSFAPMNEAHARYWTTRYPTVALFPMAALVREARALDYGAATMPLLVIYSEQDQVIDPAAIAPVIDAWAGPVRRLTVELDAGDDPYSHVIAGDALSPGPTPEIIAHILEWAGTL